MSVFSMIKKGREAAKEHNAKRAEKERKEAEKPPYRHVPRHAAIDALSGGPSSHREGDRVKIVEQNKRRSAMTASGLGMSGMMTPVHSGMATPVHSGMPRTNSSLSYVSYPAAYASPVVQVPRAYSYSSMTPGWFQPGNETPYTPVEHPSAMASKGKEIERVVTHSGRGSRSSSKVSGHRVPVEAGSSKDGEVSPVGSSSGSTSSQDDLEMKLAKRNEAASALTAPAKAPRPASEIPDYFHRLHPSSHSRKTSDPAHNPTYYPPQARNLYSQYAPRPGPPSRTNSNGAIPPVPALPQTQLMPAYQTAISAASSTSSVTMVPAASTLPLAAKISTPVEELSYAFEGPLPTELPIQYGSATTTPAQAPSIVPAPKQDRKSRRLSKTTRFTELETIDSNISSFSASLDFGFSSSKETAQVAQTLITSSPTLSTSTPSSPGESGSPQQRKGKLSKSAPKSGPLPVVAPKAKKTNRWSLRGSKPAAVAG